MTLLPLVFCSLQFQTITGSEIQGHLDPIAKLRIDVFREYPYLYEGTLDAEKDYLAMYARSANSLFILVKDEDKVVGAVTGLPLEELIPEYWDVFRKQQIPTKTIFYLGELVLLKDYRGKGIGERLYAQFETLVKEKGSYQSLTLREILREEQNTSLDPFWEKLGFVKHPEWISNDSWTEVGDEQETRHSMIFWSKSL